MPEKSRIGDMLRHGGAFLIVGGAAFVVDAAVYNLLVFWVTGIGPLFDAPVFAKVIAIVVATMVTYVGNRFWTFSKRRLRPRLLRYLLFIAINLVAVLLQLGCLAFSRYVLGLDSVLADNISGTLLGQAIATMFRFVAYDRWVFPDEPGTGDRMALEQA
ncbi:MAG: GtrA family protein [Microbacterium sp.]|uniref:GtrA family protein n=1 Tax=Microbacterium sp. TaxID=51671 RepID=UPI0039E5DC57